MDESMDLKDLRFSLDPVKLNRKKIEEQNRGVSTVFLTRAEIISGSRELRMSKIPP